ncbi:alpha/beta hydrolase, partial [Mycobacterium riyadhense]
TSAAPEPPPAGDVTARRAITRQVFAELVPTLPAIAGVKVRRYTLDTDDGAALTLSWFYGTQTASPGSAVLYLHGGGMIVGLHEFGGLYDWLAARYVAESTVPMLLVDYRIAPEYPHPVPVEDCYAALQWLAAHADELGVDPARVAVMGDSAGGGLSAAVCLLARDRGGPAIALQLLIYPMLDDRTTLPDPELAPTAIWSYDDNITGWQALLGEHAGSESVSAYAAAARAADLSLLPPAYIDVGDLDIFRDEDLAYARRLARAGVTTEVHVHPGCPHVFDILAPNTAVSRRVIADRVRRLR